MLSLRRDVTWYVSQAEALWRRARSGRARVPTRAAYHTKFDPALAAEVGSSNSPARTTFPCPATRPRPKQRGQLSLAWLVNRSRLLHRERESAQSLRNRSSGPSHSYVVGSRRGAGVLLMGSTSTTTSAGGNRYQQCHYDEPEQHAHAASSGRSQQ